MSTLRNRCTRYVLASWLLIASGTLLAGTGADGPYLDKDGGDHWIARWVTPENDELPVRSEPVTIGQSVTIGPVNKVPAFEVVLREPAAAAPDRVDTSPDVPLLVVADTHGEYEILVELLRRHGVVGDELHWTFGKGHLAFLGDIFDRGAHQTEILWLIYKLEAEAAEAGGAVHLLLGNHEAMVLRGDARYLNPKYLETAKALGVASYSDLFAPASLLGQWLRSKPSIIKFNDLLLVHGGISPALVAGRYAPDTINQTVRSALSGPGDIEEGLPKLMLGRTGPLWYRGYFPMSDKPPEATIEDIDAALAHFDAEMILVGHTPVPRITPLHQGKVLAVHVYPHLDEDDGSMLAEAALLRNGVWYRVSADGTSTPILP